MNMKCKKACRVSLRRLSDVVQVVMTEFPRSSYNISICRMYPLL